MPKPAQNRGIMKKIYRKDNKFIMEIPAEENRLNPFMEEESRRGELGTYPTLTGLIIRHNKDGNDWDEIGFAQTIDRDYKDKCDDVGGFIFMWYNGEKEFVKKCKELNLGIVYLDF